MPTFTVERSYLVPIYQHITLDAPDAGAAMRAALASECWDGAKTDYESARPEYVSGCWLGEQDHVGVSISIPDDLAEKPVRVVVVVEGGGVQQLLGNQPVDVVVLDYDTDDAEDVFDIPQTGENRTVEATMFATDTEVVPAFVDDLFAIHNRGSRPATMDEAAPEFCPLCDEERAGGPNSGSTWTCGGCNALVTSDQPDGSEAIVASFHEGSMSRDEAAIDLRLAGVHPGDVDARLAVDRFGAAVASLADDEDDPANIVRDALDMLDRVAWAIPAPGGLRFLDVGADGKPTAYRVTVTKESNDG